MNKIIINGKEIECDGNNIQVINNKVYVDGKIISEEAKKKSNICIWRCWKYRMWRISWMWQC